MNLLLAALGICIATMAVTGLWKFAVWAFMKAAGCGV